MEFRLQNHIMGGGEDLSAENADNVAFLQQLLLLRFNTVKQYHFGEFMMNMHFFQQLIYGCSRWDFRFIEIVVMG